MLAPSRLRLPCLSLVAMLFALVLQACSDDSGDKRRLWERSFVNGRRALQRKDYHAAEVAFTEAASEINSKTNSPEERADTLVGLARTYTKQEAYDKARPLFEEALKIYTSERTESPDLKQRLANSAAQTILDLADLYKATGLLERARQTLSAAMADAVVRQALLDLKNRLAESLVDTLTLQGRSDDLRNLDLPIYELRKNSGNTLEKRWDNLLESAQSALSHEQNYVLAEKLATQALSQVNDLNKSSERKIKTLLLLGQIYSVSGESQKSEKYYRLAMQTAINGKSSGFSHSDVKSTLAPLMKCLIEQSKFSQAIETGHQLHEKLKELLGPYDASANDALLYAAEAQEKTKDYRAAANTLKIVIKNLEHVPQPVNSYGRSFLTNAQTKLVRQYLHLAQWVNAEEALQVALTEAANNQYFAMDTVYEEYSDEVKEFIAAVPPAHALRVSQKWLALIESEYGASDQHALKARALRADALLRSGDKSRAHEEFRNCLAELKRMAKPSDPIVLMLQAKLSSTLTYPLECQAGEKPESAWDRMMISADYYTN